MCLMHAACVLHVWCVLYRYCLSIALVVCVLISLPLTPYPQCSQFCTMSFAYRIGAGKRKTSLTRHCLWKIRQPAARPLSRRWSVLVHRPPLGLNTDKRLAQFLWHRSSDSRQTQGSGTQGPEKIWRNLSQTSFLMPHRFTQQAPSSSC